MRILLKRKPFAIGLAVVFLSVFGCANEPDYPQKAKAFYAQYAGSRELDLLVHYNIKRRADKLYIQACQPLPDDATKIRAIYGSYNADDPDEKIELAKLKIAFTTWDGAGSVVPEYETVNAADTASSKGRLILHLREAVSAFHKLGMREVICAGPEVVYLVQKEFMLIYVPEAGKAPASIKNVATKLDENWYYEISLEHQEEQGRRLDVIIRELWNSAESKSPEDKP